MKQLLLLILLLSSFRLSAESTSISYTFSSGEYNYKSHFISLRKNFDDLSYGLSYANSSDDFIDSGKLTGSYTNYFSDTSDVTINIIYSTENDINGFGGSVALNHDLEWGKMQTTSFWGEFEYITYLEKTTSTYSSTASLLTTKSISKINSSRFSSTTTQLNTFGVSTISMGIDHYFGNIFGFGGSYTLYNYTNSEIDKLNDGDSTADSLSANLKNSSSAYFSLIYFPAIQLDISISKTTSNDATNDSTGKGITARIKPLKSITLSFGMQKKSYADSDDTTYSVGILLHHL